MITRSRIIIEDLLLRCIIGINDDERRAKQDVLINIIVEADLSLAADSDDINNTVNYRSICKRVIQLVENEGPFDLLEHLTKLILEAILTEFLVDKVSVRVAKPHALRFAHSVAIELEGVKKDAGCQS